MTSYQNYDFPNNCEDYIHRIGRTGVRLPLVLYDRLTYPIAARWNEGHVLHLLHH